MNLEERLGAELSSVADTVATPTVSTAALAAAGRRERGRRRTAWTAGGAAVAVAAVAGVVALTAGTTGPTPEPAPAPSAPSAPEGDPMPYQLGSTLHYGDRTVRTGRYYSLQYADGSTVVGRQWEGPWFQVVDDALVPLPTATTTSSGVRLSSDGARAAWVTTVDATTEQVVLWDVRGERELGRVDVRVGRGFDNTISVNGIDADGRVSWTRFGDIGAVTLWRPGFDPVEVTGTPDEVTGPQWPGGISQNLGTRPGVYGTVADDGTFEPRGTVPAFGSAQWSPDGDRLAFTSTGRDGVDDPSDRVDPVLVQDLDGTVTELPVPETLTGATVTAWESDEVVTVTTTGPTRRGVVRCDVVAVACEIVDDDVPLVAQVPDNAG